MLDGREARILGRLPGCQGVLVVHRRHHVQCRVPPVPVVVIDPGSDPGPGLGFGGEGLHRAQLELQGGVPGLDDRVIPRRQLRLIASLRSELCG